MFIYQGQEGIVEKGFIIYTKTYIKALFAKMATVFAKIC